MSQTKINKRQTKNVINTKLGNICFTFSQFPLCVYLKLKYIKRKKKEMVKLFVAPFYPSD